MLNMLVILQFYVSDEKYIENVIDCYIFMQNMSNMFKMLLIFTFLSKSNEFV